MSSIGKDRAWLHHMIAASAIGGKELDRRSVCVMNSGCADLKLKSVR